MDNRLNRIGRLTAFCPIPLISLHAVLNQSSCLNKKQIIRFYPISILVSDDRCGSVLALACLRYSTLSRFSIKTTPKWDTFSDSPKSCRETVMAGNLGLWKNTAPQPGHWSVSFAERFSTPARTACPTGAVPNDLDFGGCTPPLARRVFRHCAARVLMIPRWATNKGLDSVV
jgi:hypothetical protein